MLASALALALVADIFSPGELSRAHQKLEGLKNCTQCHAAGQKLSPEHCLACHAEIKATLDAKAGLHGRLAPAERACEACHHEHQGRDFDLVGLDRKGFDHAGRAGFALRGAHAKVDCMKCHDARFIKDAALKKLIADKGSHQSFLGLPTTCASCHADVHQGQLGGDCNKCHDERKFAPAPGFDHARTDFALKGRHARTECASCHKTVNEVVRFRPVEHASCMACHTDVHEGRFGKDCASCHVETSWRDQKGAAGTGQRAFHSATRFPLRGAHDSVACKKCHGPFPDGRRAQFKGLAFGKCGDCHGDAHAGQLQGDCARCHTERSFAATTFGRAQHTSWKLAGAHEAAKCDACHVKSTTLKAKSRALFKLQAGACADCHADAHAGQLQGDCARCHGEQGFAPPRYEVEDHTGWPLAGAHGAVACALCHGTNDRVAAAVKKQKPLHAGPFVRRASGAVFRARIDVGRCESCHRDPHGGLYAADARGCQACHTVAAFHPAKFDHQSAQACASCHADPHAAQLGQDCARCHATKAWDPMQFRHEAVWPLEGKHAAAACALCHPRVEVAPGVTAALYKPRPTSCEGCHADFHKGAFERFAR